MGLMLGLAVCLAVGGPERSTACDAGVVVERRPTAKDVFSVRVVLFSTRVIIIRD